MGKQTCDNNTLETLVGFKKYDKKINITQEQYKLLKIKAPHYQCGIYKCS